MIVGLLFSAGLFTGGHSTDAAAQDCGCDRAIPYPGTYSIIGPDFSDFFTLTVEDSADVCGASVRFEHPQSGASAACQGTGYYGTIDHMSQPLMFEGEPGRGLRMGSEFNGVIQRPGLIASVPGEPFTPNFTMVHQGDGPASACLCERVRESIESARFIQSVYADADLIAFAETNEMVAINSSERAQPDIGGDHYLSIVTETYRDMVTAEYKSHLGSANYQREPELWTPDPMNSSVAFTNLRTCEVTDPGPRNRDGTCRPHIELIAVRAHEDTHARRCDALTDASGEEGYVRWANHPTNHAEDEYYAYQAALDVMEPWYAAQCEG